MYDIYIYIYILYILPIRFAATFLALPIFRHGRVESRRGWESSGEAWLRLLKVGFGNLLLGGFSFNHVYHILLSSHTHTYIYIFIFTYYTIHMFFFFSWKIAVLCLHH